MPVPGGSEFARRITLRQLEIFEAVVRHGGFSRAAEAVHLTQPSVSMQVARLGEAVGRPLFEQIGRQVHLTAEGRRLHACAGELFEALERFQAEMADMEGLKRGRLRLAVVTTAEYFAPRVLGAFSRKYPGIEVELVVRNRRRVLERVAANDDDLYILGQPPQGLEVTAEPFLQNPHVPLAPAGHVLAGRTAVPLARFAREPMIMRERGSGTRKAMEGLFREAGLSPLVRMELGGTEAIKQAVAGGLGVTVLSAHALSLSGVAPLFCIPDVVGFPLRRQWRLVRPRGKALSPAARAFRAFVLEEGPALVGPLPVAGPLCLPSPTGRQGRGGEADEI